MGGSGISVLPNLDGDRGLARRPDPACREATIDSPTAGPPEPVAMRWQSALPGIRARLLGRHRHRGVATVDAVLTRAIEDTAGARVQNYRAILVERRADRLLREAASPIEVTASAAY